MGELLWCAAAILLAIVHVALNAREQA